MERGTEYITLDGEENFMSPVIIEIWKPKRRDCLYQNRDQR
jgi:hypothetical protein